MLAELLETVGRSETAVAVRTAVATVVATVVVAVAMAEVAMAESGERCQCQIQLGVMAVEVETREVGAKTEAQLAVAERAAGKSVGVASSR